MKVSFFFSENFVAFTRPLECKHAILSVYHSPDLLVTNNTRVARKSAHKLKRKINFAGVTCEY